MFDASKTVDTALMREAPGFYLEGDDMEGPGAAGKITGSLNAMMRFLAAGSAALNEAGARSTLPPPGTAFPCGLVPSEAGWTAGQVEEWATEFRKLAASGAPPRLLDPLPRRARLRLWLTKRVDSAAIRLLGSGHERAAIALWRVTGRW